MKKYIIFVFAIFASIACIAQTFEIANYNRSSISAMIIPNGGKNGDALKAAFNNGQSIELDQRYFSNPVNKTIVNARNSESDITSFLKREHAASQSLMPWRNMNTLIDRATYNLTTQQRSQMASSFRGADNIKDERWFKHLLQSNYLLVVAVEDLENISKVYNRKQLANLGVQLMTGTSYSSVNQDREGFVGKATAYLYHITMNDVDYANFFKYWDNDAQHLSYNYNIELVKKETLGIDGTRPNEKTKDEGLLMRLFANEAVNQSLRAIGDHYLPLTPKAMVLSEKPVKAELGAKEGLRPDDLIYAYQLKEKKDGSLTYDRNGVYRVRSVADNRTNSTAASTFYNVNWGSAKEGMVLVPKEEMGWSFSPGVYVYPKRVYRLDVSMSLSKMRAANRSSRTKFIFGVGYSGDFVDENAFFEHYATVSHFDDFREANGLYTLMYGAGIQQDLYILPFVQISPYLMVMVEHSWYKDKPTVDDAMGYFQLPRNYGRIMYPQLGVKVPINLTYYLKLVPEVAYAMKINSLSVGAGSSSLNDGTYPLYIEKNDKLFLGASLQLDL